MTFRRARRRARIAAACVALLAGAVLAGAAPGGADVIDGGDASSAKVQTQADHAKFAWDPTAGALMTDAPTVTVSQTQNLTNQVVHVSWSHFTPSSIAGGGVGYQPGATFYAVGVFECRGTDPQVPPFEEEPGHPSDCYHYPVGSANAPKGAGNEVVTFTGADGTGEADIQIETAIENDFLGCDASTPCSLAVVPQFGGAVSDTYSVKSCTNHKGDRRVPATSASAADQYIGDGCSWADRLVFPLTFAPTPGACPTTAATFAGQGSPMLQRAMQQWRPGWCHDVGTPVTFDYDAGINEYSARDHFTARAGALSSQPDVAFTTQPATPTQAMQRAFTYAPVTNTGIAIAYYIDDNVTGKLVQNLRLNARLMAKLLTQSYSLRWSHCPTPPVQSTSCDPGDLGNPDSIVADPEFRELNPQWADWAQGTEFTDQSIGNILPTVVYGNSDLTYELTRWVASDRDAAAFLAGTPDRWGMHVNTYYKNPGYPVSSLVNQDPGYVDPQDGCDGGGTMQVAWNPQSGLDTVAKLLLANRSSAQAQSVPDVTPPCSYGKADPEQVGKRLLFAVVDAGQAAAYRFPVASIQNAAGNYVAPSAASLAAGAANMRDNPDGITQRENLASKAAGAYPLTVTDYAMVPTCKASANVVKGIDAVLDLAAASGARPGLQLGDLYPGYAPLTGAQHAQTVAATKLVAAQNRCIVPGRPSPSPGAPSTPVGSSGTDVSGEGGQGRAGSSNGANALGESAQTGGERSANGSRSATAAGSTSGIGVRSRSGGRPAVLVPALIAGAVILLLGGPGGWFVLTAGSVPGWLRRIPVVGDRLVGGSR